MRFSQRIPGPPLSQTIDRLWLLEDSSAQAGSFRQIAPDGCSEVIFQLREQNQACIRGKILQEPRAFLISQLSVPFSLKPAARVKNLGIRFRPGCLYPFLPVPQHEIADQVVALGDVWSSLLQELAVQLEPEAPEERLFCIVEKEMSKRVGSAARETSLTPLLRRLARGGRVSISQLARDSGWSLRQLERRFLREVGIPPKRLSRIFRLQALLAQLSTQPGPVKWAELAVGAGYSDQAHLIRESQFFLGTTPTRLNRDHEPTAGILVQGP